MSLFASWPGAMINNQWLELPISRTNFNGPKDLWAIEVRLYMESVLCYQNYKFIFNYGSLNDFSLVLYDW